jgi:hypothetical protein
MALAPAAELSGEAGCQDVVAAMVAVARGAESNVGMPGAVTGLNLAAK